MHPDCLEPGVVTYNAAISACGDAKQSGMALELRGVMHPNCLEPDVVTYNAAISARDWAKQPGMA